MTTLPLLLALLESLVAPLGHDSFAVREAAQRRLEAALLAPGGFVLVPYLEARKDADPEVRNRVGVGLSGFYHIRPTAYARLPWLDSLPGGPQFKRVTHRKVRYRDSDLPDGIGMESPQVSDYDYFMAEARYMVGGGLPAYGEYALATCLWTRERLRRGDSRQAIVEDLDRMVLWEKEWKKKQGLPEDY